MLAQSIQFARLKGSLRDRIRASAIHLLWCLAVAAVVLALVFFGWYPPPLDRISGLATILVIMLGADVVLGPLVTLIIFDRTKKHLKLDLAFIILVQVSALAYGMYTVYQGRPAHLVFVKDRFETIAPADIRPEERAAARENPAAAVELLRPKWVAARIPADPQERNRILFESVQQGRDVQHHPRLYEPYSAQARAAAARAAPIEQLRQFNPDKAAEIDALPAKLGLSADMLRYVPIKGPQGDAAVILRADTGEVLRVVGLRPWS